MDFSAASDTWVGEIPLGHVRLDLEGHCNWGQGWVETARSQGQGQWDDSDQGQGEWVLCSMKDAWALCLSDEPVKKNLMLITR